MTWDWKDYEEKLIAKTKVKNSTRTYTQELVLPFLCKFYWNDNEVENHMRAFWALVHRYHKAHTDDELKRTMVWAASHGLHIKQVLKVLNNGIKKKSTARY